MTFIGSSFANKGAQLAKLHVHAESVSHILTYEVMTSGSLILTPPIAYQLSLLFCPRKVIVYSVIAQCQRIISWASRVAWASLDELGAEALYSYSDSIKIKPYSYFFRCRKLS